MTAILAGPARAEADGTAAGVEADGAWATAFKVRPDAKVITSANERFIRMKNSFGIPV
jgi:hypothetical protein